MPSRYGVDKSLNSLEGMSAYENGGKGSGNFGHSGRPGLVGGSGDGTGVAVSDNKIDQMSVWNCRRPTVSCRMDNVEQDRLIGVDTKNYYSEYGYTDEATMFESHYQTREDFAEAVRVQDGLDKLNWAKRDDSEWNADENSIGMIKERIKGNCDALLYAMASHYHGLDFVDGDRAVDRANNVASSIRKDISLLREKMVGMKPDRKRIANDTIKVAEKALKMNGKTGEKSRYYAVTEEGEIHSFSKDSDGSEKYRFLAENVRKEKK